MLFLKSHTIYNQAFVGMNVTYLGTYLLAKTFGNKNGSKTVSKWVDIYRPMYLPKN